MQKNQEKNAKKLGKNAEKSGKSAQKLGKNAEKSGKNAQKLGKNAEKPGTIPQNWRTAKGVKRKLGKKIPRNKKKSRRFSH